MDGFAGATHDRVGPSDAAYGWAGASSQTKQPNAVGVWARDGDMHG